MKLILPLFVIFVVGVNSQISPVPHLFGQVHVKFAAFVEIFDDIFENGENRFTLYVSTFNPLNFGKDPKYYLRSPGKLLANVSAWEFVELDKTATWPNNPDFMPAEVVGSQGIVWTSGFLVPGKQNGSLELYDTVSDPPVGPFSITGQDEITWSYHRVIWKDIDGDGDLDALTARFHVPLTANTRTQFLWLENPGLELTDTPSSGWSQHILHDSKVDGERGPDVHFRNFEWTDTDGVTYDCILAAEFWHEELAIYYTTTGWTDWSKVGRIPLDLTVGQSFDVYVDDFNRDGKIDLMATSYAHKWGNVYAYEIPLDFKNASAYTKHVVADGFQANTIIGGQSMTPGSPKPFYPSKAHEEELVEGRQRKPFILLSGDDDGRHYILEPTSEDPQDWAYTKHMLIDTEKTTSGKFAAVDLDGDGYTEIVAAGYTSNTIYVFSYKPQ